MHVSVPENKLETYRAYRLQRTHRSSWTKSSILCYQVGKDGSRYPPSLGKICYSSLYYGEYAADHRTT